VNFSSFKKRVNEFVTEKKIIKTLFLMGAHDRLKYDKTRAFGGNGLR
jgi:hypothetical protein